MLLQGSIQLHFFSTNLDIDGLLSSLYSKDYFEIVLGNTQYVYTWFAFHILYTDL